MGWYEVSIDDGVNPAVVQRCIGLILPSHSWVPVDRRLSRRRQLHCQGGPVTNQEQEQRVLEFDSHTTKPVLDHRGLWGT